MKPLRTRLMEAREHLGVPFEILERDYVLSWILAAISRTDTLRETLVLKGGTALKKCYFGRYRFSEDLDFSAVGPVPEGGSIENEIRKSCSLAENLLNEYEPATFYCERYTEREPHPAGQEAANREDS